jgi:cystathionine gamma-synthase
MNPNPDSDFRNPNKCKENGIKMSDDHIKNNQPGLETLAIWAGEEGKSGWERSTQIPVVHSVSFGYDDLDDWYQVALGKEKGHIYSRNTNPTVAAFEEKVRQLEGAAAATSFSTGMAAISNTLFAIMAPGDRVVSVKDTYGGTNEIFTRFLPRYQIEASLCDTTDHEAI